MSCVKWNVVELLIAINVQTEDEYIIGKRDVGHIKLMRRYHMFQYIIVFTPYIITFIKC